jgi:CheY-like chemotaxis protein
MDIRLPDMDGYEAIRQIKMYKPKLKIIAQTAYAAHDEKQKAFEAGCIDYISKPLKRNLLLSMINKYL